MGCTCTEGWTGDHCEVNIDECEQKTFTCVKNSVCKDTDGSYECECEAGYEKKDGECTEIDECATKPCKHGSACTDGFLKFTCDCVRGWHGITCEEVDDDLQSASKKTETSGTSTAIGLVGGIVAAIVIIVIAVIVACVVLARKKTTTTVAPFAPVPEHYKTVEAPEKYKPSFTEKEEETHEEEEVVASEPVTEPQPEGARPQSLSQHASSAGGEPLKLGQRVVAHGYQAGVIMYIGELKNMPSMRGMVYLGIKLDVAEGSGDGSVNGVRYFDCDPFCSVFVTPHAVTPEQPTS